MSMQVWSGDLVEDFVDGSEPRKTILDMHTMLDDGNPNIISNF